MKINEVEQLVGISKKNIRFYEQEGLISPGRNSENGYRTYTAEDAAVLREIKLLRKLSVPLDEIRRIQCGGHTLQEAMRRQMVALQLQIDGLYHASLLCAKIDQSGLALGELDVDAYLDEMERMEGDGVGFVNIHARDTTRRYLMPAAAVLTAVTLVMGLLSVLFWVLDGARLGWPALLLIFLPPITVGGAAIAVILRRIWGPGRAKKGPGPPDA